MMVRILLAAAVLIVSTASAQAKLGIDNIQATYGRLGPERKSLDLYRYDELFFRFTVTGAKPDAEGKVDGSVLLQVLDGAGKVLGENRIPAKGILALGGNSFPFAVSLPSEQLPLGKYTVKITVRDNLSEESATFQRKVTVKALDFKIVNLQFSRDADGKIAAPGAGAVGETLYFSYRVIGFDNSLGKIHIDMTMQVLDAEGKDVLPHAFTNDYRQDDAAVAKKYGYLSFPNNLFLNRVGKFTLRITAADRLGKKSTTFEVPIQVTAP
jgi:hypothetical protein